MNIGEAAKATGITPKMIRHYEQVGLIQPAERSDANYRVYSDMDLNVLRFIRQARRLGFATAQIATLLALWRDRERPSRDVKQLARAHIVELDAKIAELAAMKTTLTNLVDCCHGDARPECPILDELARPSTKQA